jgi:manganese/zinc/iron transport system ATP- binding protein
MKKALEIDQLFVGYDRRTVLWDVSLSIPTGVMLCILGPNGAGKSTLLKSALGLVRPLSGKIDFFGEPIDKCRTKIAYVPQRESVDWDFPITALDVVLMGRYGRIGVFQKLRKADREAAQNALELVGMSAYSKHQIGELSGGQQQRLFLARALVQNPDLFLLDEPFAGIDLATEKILVDLLKKLAGQGKTVIAVHHDLPTVPEYFDWTVLLNTHVIACGPVSAVYTRENLLKTYGKTAPLFEEAIQLSAKNKVGL